VLHVYFIFIAIIRVTPGVEPSTDVAFIVEVATLLCASTVTVFVPLETMTNAKPPALVDLLAAVMLLPPPSAVVPSYNLVSI
jgi:hypothetical protein